jgi:hypothetical protein
MRIKKLSRTKIELFVECPHCFYLDQVRKIKRPDPYPYSLNNAVDGLLKKEMDTYRATQQSHPIHAALGLVPCNHPKMDDWREPKHKGVEYHHPRHNCIYRGGIDDLWVKPKSNLHFVVDYKCTAKTEKVVKLPYWADAYRRQMEVYQWLLRKNGLKVSDTAYFLYCTGDVNAPNFSSTLSFHMELIPYNGSDRWVDGTLKEMQLCLNLSKPPAPSKNCNWCKYRNA